MAPPVGLEPTTPWLTVRCSTDWAKEEYKITNKRNRNKNRAAPHSYRWYAVSDSRPTQLHSYAFPIRGIEENTDTCRQRPIFPGRFQPSIFSTDELNCRVRNGNGWTLTVTATDCIRILLCQHRPIFPGRFQPSIFSTDELNCRVRNGNGWTLTVTGTDFWCTFRDSNPGPTD